MEREGDDDEHELLSERLWRRLWRRFCLFGEGDAELEEDDDDKEEELESERGDLLRYLLFSLPLAGGLGGGVGSVHDTVSSSAARTRRGAVGTTAAAGLVSDRVPGRSARRCVAAEDRTAPTASPSSQAEVGFLHSAAALESWVATWSSSEV